MSVVTQLVKPLPSVGRKWRRPKHRFAVEHLPYQITPFFISPVLPGDTLKKAMFQSRGITDPISANVMGWHLEHYLFFVRLQDLEIRDIIPEMFMDPAFNSSAYHRPANPKTFHAGGSIDWVEECLKRVTAEYFRDEGEAWNVAGSVIDGLPIAQAFGREDGWTDSLIQDDEAPEVAPADDELGVLYGEAYAKWSQMAQLKLTGLTFEEYLERAYGVDQPKEEVDPYKPELLRYSKTWQYPSNTINPADGAPVGAVSWSIQEQANKSRFFKEPGFVFGVTLARPKVFMKNQKGTATALLTKGERWLPTIIMGGQEAGTAHESIVNIPAGTGPLAGIVEATAPDGGYWVDLVGLFMYGEQFVNISTDTAGRNFVSLPNSKGQTKYVTQADINGLFKTAASNKIRQDGIVDLRILSRLKDTTR